ncbi:MAG: hypothetical protein F6K25_25025 [Okeania sp. SIO2G4]|nr:hypothetical protein [Okeania sp. SIO4D6]NEP38713.1 hypothetical protein [Okeania sp. SIO2H7]NEP75486.1 hypothetical protein [Okeania sp. SIO2G5]NEP95240.1 hypothetical protein [Okeania sp. SIO2F5]NEQ93739.1 hypothetical protein [Okeania sp. SIO2G4]
MIDETNILDFLGLKTLYSWPILAQQVDVNLWSDVQKAWSNFIECGQVWALLVGLFIGWMVKSILP